MSFSRPLQEKAEVLLCAGLRAKHLTYLTSFKPEDSLQERHITPFLQMRLREVRCFAQGCTARKQQALLPGACSFWTRDGHPAVSWVEATWDRNTSPCAMWSC